MRSLQFRLKIVMAFRARARISHPTTLVAAMVVAVLGCGAATIHTGSGTGGTAAQGTGGSTGGSTTGGGAGRGGTGGSTGGSTTGGGGGGGATGTGGGGGSKQCKLGSSQIGNCVIQ